MANPPTFQTRASRTRIANGSERSRVDHLESEFPHLSVYQQEVLSGAPQISYSNRYQLEGLMEAHLQPLSNRMAQGPHQLYACQQPEYHYATTNGAGIHSVCNEAAMANRQVLPGVPSISCLGPLVTPQQGHQSGGWTEAPSMYLVSNQPAQAPQQSYVYQQPVYHKATNNGGGIQSLCNQAAPPTTLPPCSMASLLQSTVNRACTPADSRELFRYADISIFTGKRTNSHTTLESEAWNWINVEFRSAIEANNWSHSTCFAVLPLRLTGYASFWYRLFENWPRHQGNPLGTEAGWRAFFYDFCVEFIDRSPSRKLHQFSLQKQWPGDTLEDFVTAYLCAVNELIELGVALALDSAVWQFICGIADRAVKEMLRIQFQRNLAAGTFPQLAAWTALAIQYEQEARVSLFQTRTAPSLGDWKPTKLSTNAKVKRSSPQAEVEFLDAFINPRGDGNSRGNQSLAAENVNNTSRLEPESSREVDPMPPAVSSMLNPSLNDCCTLVDRNDTDWLDKILGSLGNLEDLPQVDWLPRTPHLE